MSKRKPKLELTWIGKENRPKLEPRILLEETEKSDWANYSGILENRLNSTSDIMIYWIYKINKNSCVVNILFKKAV